MTPGPIIERGVSHLWPSDKERPPREWLRDEDRCEARVERGTGAIIGPAQATVWAEMSCGGWSQFDAIRLHASHPASVCAQSALDRPEGPLFWPTHGGDGPPVDREPGTAVLFGDGTISPGWMDDNWSWGDLKNKRNTIVGYVKGSREDHPAIVAIRKAANEIGCFEPSWEGDLQVILNCVKEYHQAYFADPIAEAKLAAERADGMVLVPRKPTQAILRAWRRLAVPSQWLNAEANWAGMIAGIDQAEPSPAEAYAAATGNPASDFEAAERVRAWEKSRG